MNCARCNNRIRKTSPDPDFCRRCYNCLDEMLVARAIRTLAPNLSDNKRQEMFYFLQVFHPERGEKANRELAFLSN